MSSSKIVGASESLKVIIPECGYCKRTIVKSGAKCNICTKVYHPSCANKAKKCCKEDLSTSGDLNSADMSPMSDSINKMISSESTHNELLLKIIFELESKNSILMENNSLLRFKISTLEAEINNKNKVVNNPYLKNDKNINTNTRVDKRNKHVNIVMSEESRSNVVVGDPETAAPANSSSTGDPKRRMSEARTSVVSNESSVASSSSGNDIGLISNEAVVVSPMVDVKKKSESEWNVVTRRKTNKKPNKIQIIGCSSMDSLVEGIEKFRPFHVSNLKPEITADDLQSFLSKNFSNVKCEKLVSRYPESYSSFKVLLPSSDYEKAMNASNWPKRASVHRFFQPKPMKNPVS